MIKLSELYNQILVEAGGQDAGEYELHTLTLEWAVKYCIESGLQIPNIESNLKLAMDIFSNGLFDRDEMPVISNSQVIDFAEKLHSVYGLSSVNKLIVVKDLKPIQRQCYLDRSVQSIVDHGIDETIAYLKKTLTVVSNDGYLIDGNHRLLSGLIIDPNTVMNTTMFDVQVNRLFSLAVVYSDKVGNIRNA